MALRSVPMMVFPYVGEVKTSASGETVTGQEIDLKAATWRGCRKMTLLIATGATTGTSVTIVAKIEVSDTAGSGYADLTGATTGTDDSMETRDRIVKMGTVDLTSVTKRYLRCSVTVAGTTPSIPWAAIYLFHDYVTSFDKGQLGTGAAAAAGVGKFDQPEFTV